MWQEGTHLRVAPSTAATYDQLLSAYLSPFFNGMKIGAIGWEDVDRWVSQMLNTKSPKITRNAPSVLNQVFKHAIKAKARKDNPALDHRIPLRRKPVMPLTMDQLRDLVDAAAEHWRPAVWTMIYTGMRPGELCGLRVENVDFERSSIRIIETVLPVKGSLTSAPTKTKTGERTVTLPTWLTSQITEALGKREAEQGSSMSGKERVFVAAKGGDLDSRWFNNRVVKPAAQAAGLPPMTSYSLRHTHASLMLHLGASVKAVQERMGHSDASVTMNVYGHLYADVQEELTARLDAEREASAARPKSNVVAMRRTGS